MIIFICLLNAIHMKMLNSNDESELFDILWLTKLGYFFHYYITYIQTSFIPQCQNILINQRATQESKTSRVQRRTS